MKTYYSDYVQHCIRFYLKHPEPIYKSEIDKANWLAVEEVFMRYEDNKKDLIKKLYVNEQSLADSISYISKNEHISTSYLWALIGSFEKQVAKVRDLT